MLNRLQKSLQDKDKGFTLIELLVVVVIIGILAAIAIPVFLSQREKGADAATKSDIRNAATLMETWFVDGQTYAATPAGTQIATLQKSTGVTVSVLSASATAYCLKGVNTGHAVAAGTFYYNSSTGGLTATACT